jgi:competence protein ComGF
LCSAKLLGTKQGIATILLRKVDDGPVELQVLNGRVYCELNGKLIKFRSWKELLRRRLENKRGKEKKRQKRLLAS